MYQHVWKETRDVGRVRQHAQCIVELNHNNTEATGITIRPRAKLGVIAVVGRDEEKNPRILTEIGIGHGNPWGATHQNRIAKRKRAVQEFCPSAHVRFAICAAMRAIAERRMARWLTRGTSYRVRQMPWQHKRKRQRAYNIRRGIRFAFDEKDASFIAFLRWHEARHNSNLQQYLATRSARMLQLLSRALGDMRYKNGALKGSSQRLLGQFNARTLRDPYIFTEVAKHFHRARAPKHCLGKLVELLVQEKILPEDIYSLMEKRPREDMVPHYGIEIRFQKKRRNGFLSYMVYPKTITHLEQ